MKKNETMKEIKGTSKKSFTSFEHKQSRSDRKDLWKNLWEKKGNELSGELKLEDLMNIVGWFHNAAGDLSINNWLSFVKKIQEQLNIKDKKKILEIGCGAGAFLYPMYDSNIKIFGIDYSSSLIKLCSRIMPTGVFNIAEAKSLPFKKFFFDAIICNSVFQYFENLNYAEKVINEMERVLNNVGSIAILDITDASKKNKYESLRRSKLGNNEYNRLYGNLTHQFYKIEWFENIANSYNLHCAIHDQNIIGYENSKFRFNVFLDRK